MDNSFTETNGSSIWPYVIVGSAIGGAMGYLFVSDSGKRLRQRVTHPDQLADDLDGVRTFVENKARDVTDRVHGFIGRAKQSIDEGQRAYQHAGDEYRSRARRLETKNKDIASTVHQTVDRMSHTAAHIEQSVLDPICEMGALFRGIERGIRSLIGRTRERSLSSPDETTVVVDQRTFGEIRRY
jgi:gas vesicle protein